MSKNDDALRVVAYADQRHRVSCAVFDPSPRQCDCGAADAIPLVTKQQAEAIIAKLVAENEAQAALLRQAVEAVALIVPALRQNPTLRGRAHETLSAIRQHLEGK